MSAYEMTTLEGEKERDMPFEGEEGRTSKWWKGNSRRVAWAVGGAIALLVAVESAHSARNSVAFHRLASGPSTSRRLVGRKAKLESLYGMNEYAGRAWVDHVLALDDEGLAPATKFTQAFLQEWQNPPIEECDKKQFYLMDMRDTQDWGHGLGSTVHVISYSLRNALDSGRIFAWHEYALGRAFVEETCLVDGVRSLDCLFVPATHCPRSSMREDNTVIGGAGKPAPNVTGIEGGYEQVPRVFHEELKRVLPYEYTVSALKYWWRGQAAAYTMRLRPESLDHIIASRLDPTAHYAFTIETGKTEVSELPMPWPLPAGAISFHVRHGNKASEMGLHPLTEYVEAGERIASLNPNAYARMAFLSSEDPDVFDEAKNIAHVAPWSTTPNMNWIWYTSHIQRLNGGPFEQLEQFGNRSATTLSWMAETLLALECDAYVGTRGSNWNQLIDQLRCVWLDYCKHPYVDVGADGDWWGYNW